MSLQLSYSTSKTKSSVNSFIYNRYKLVPMCDSGGTVDTLP